VFDLRPLPMGQPTFPGYLCASHRGYRVASVCRLSWRFSFSPVGEPSPHTLKASWQSHFICRHRALTDTLCSI